MSGPASAGGARRLVELDALRGIAATLVMLFHFTTRYDSLYGHETPPMFQVPWGDHGVSLFFMISGFVIFMTLHRVRRPLDFIVSRFSRLFPAFWAAVLITYLITALLPLPDKTVAAAAAAMNLFMIHGLARIPHVDAVYWTLEVELLFYAWALLLYSLGRLDRVHTVLLAALALRLVYFLSSTWAGIPLSSTLGHLLILPYIAWFTCGIMIYRRVAMAGVTPRADLLVLVAAITQLGIVEGPGIALLAAGLATILWLAATERMPLLANPLLAWLGAISYTLYLLHENIGWALLLRMQRAGLGTNLSILLAIAVILTIATLLTRLLERPAMDRLRRLYRESHVPLMTPRRSVALAGAFLSLFAGLAYGWHMTKPSAASSAERFANVFRPTADSAQPCPDGKQPVPLRILVLGQSNAANHGEPTSTSAATFYFEGACYRTGGPVPGATGHGGSPWPILSHALEDAIGGPIVLSVLAFNASTARDWAEPGTVHDRLLAAIADQRTHGFIPDLILWQQGEADTLAWTTRRKYRERFSALVAQLRAQGLSAPIIAALSTRCRNEGSSQVRAALRDVAAGDPSVRIGPDTDALSGQFRNDGCHFSAKGLEAVARLWLPAILATR